MSRSNGRGRAGLALVCAVLSLLVHGGAAVGVVVLQDLLPVPSVSEAGRRAAEPPKVRLLRVQTAEQEKPLAFAKTDPDRPQESPEKPDFIGARDARAASDPHAYANRSEENAPAMEGDAARQELNTVEQNRQDGFIGSEAASAPPSPNQPAPPQQSAESAEQGRPDEPSGAPEQPAEQQPAAPQEKEQAGQTVVAAESAEEKAEREEKKGESAALSMSPRKVYYDPSLTPEAQPGFRTFERRSRSTGSFVVGRGASLNVSRTPMGSYQAHLYRLIAANWYAQCDEHRGDIIPGSITVSIRINRKGRIVNMDLVRRRGAGILQQNFTLLAIRQTTPPPMPKEVQQEMVGDLLELFFTFIFQ
ncbi:MAG: hypothetical protein MR894_04275 [Akkermansia muciniphila]|nr:hypothetical protein [Akkermansia muciniphila]